MTHVRAVLAAFTVSASMSATACADAVQAGREGAEAPRQQVLVTRAAPDRFEAEMRFSEPKHVAFFARSAGDYRTATWTPLDPGVHLERVGGFDMITFDPPRREARFAFEPWGEPLPKDYVPVVAFSDGGAAVYTGQFELLDAPGRGAVEALGGDLSTYEGDQPHLSVTVRHDGSLVLDGDVLQDEASISGVGVGAYIYMGDIDPVVTSNYVGVLDPGMPEWLASRFDEDLAQMFDAFTERWGFALPERATLYFAFSGYEGEGWSYSGGVIGRLLMIRASGEAFRQATDGLVQRLVLFYAHEGAHLYQSASGVPLASNRDAWIHEGSADAMAFDVVSAGRDDRDSYLIATYAGALQSCADALQDGPLAAAGLRGAFRAHYSCGSLIALATDAALADHDLYAFWAVLTARTQAAADRDSYDGAFYRELLAELGADAVVVEAVRAIAEDELADPHGRLVALLDAAGLSPDIDETGALIGLTLP